MTSATPAELHNLESLATRCGVSPEQLLPELYQSLRRMAHQQLQGEREGHSLNTTALVHEAWMKLAASYPELAFDSERDFLALSGLLMRLVLIDGQGVLSAEGEGYEDRLPLTLDDAPPAD